VNHLSQYEHTLAGHHRDLDEKMKEAVLGLSYAEISRSCSIKEAHGKYHHEIVGVVPFYPGAVGNNSLTGNAHSISSSQVKALWLQGVTCSLAKYMSKIVIGACNEEHRSLALHHLPKLPHANVEVVNFKCQDTPVHLPFILLRHIQDNYIDKDFKGHSDSSSSSSSSSSKHARFVYFTEMDNALHLESDEVFDALVDFVGPIGYISPNRMSKKVSTSPSDLHPSAFRVNGQNVCARD
jgi:hypothetical protein